MKLVTLILSAFFALSVAAQESTRVEDILYRGQPNENVELSWDKEGTLYRTEQRPGTCTRRIPYQAEECGYETRYRRECRTEPGRNVCRTVNRRVCRDVQRTRRVCTNRPPRQVCTNRPDRRVCTTRNGRRVCRTVPGGRTCRQVPGGQTCRNVPYTARECSNVPRQECHWQPSRQVCSDVPYQEYICRTVTRYREEQYSCMRDVQVPYQGIVAKYRATVAVNFANNISEEIEFNTAITDNGKIALTLKGEPRHLVVIRSTSQNSNPNGEITELSANYLVEFFDPSRFGRNNENSISDIVINRTSNEITFRSDFITSPEAAKVSVVLTDGKNDILVFRADPFGDLTFNREGQSILFKLNATKHLRKKLRKNKKYSATIQIDFKPQGDVLNRNVPEFKYFKNFSNLRTVK